MHEDVRLYTVCGEFFVIGRLDGERFYYCFVRKKIVPCGGTLVSTSAIKNYCSHSEKTLEELIQNPENPKPIGLHEAIEKYREGSILIESKEPVSVKKRKKRKKAGSAGICYERKWNNFE